MTLHEKTSLYSMKKFETKKMTVNEKEPKSDKRRVKFQNSAHISALSRLIESSSNKPLTKKKGKEMKLYLVSKCNCCFQVLAKCSSVQLFCSGLFPKAPFSYFLPQTVEILTK